MPLSSLPTRPPRAPRPVRRAPLLLVAAGAAALALAGGATGALDRLEGDSIDARFALRGERPPSGDLLLIAIDDATLRELDARWPLRRSLHGRAIRRLHAAGARLVAYDVHFQSPTTAREDDALIRAIRRAAPVVLAEADPGPRGETSVLGGARNAARHGAVVADSRFRVEAGGFVRRLATHVDAPMPTFAAAAARAARPFAPPPAAGGALIDFAGPPGSVPQRSFADLLAGRVPASEVRGRVVVVGVTSPSLHDLHPTPTTGDELMSGAEVQAHAVQTLLAGAPLRAPGGPLGALLVVLLAAVAPLVCMRRGAVRAALAAAAVAAGLLGAAQAAFAAGLVLPVVAPLVALALATVGAVVLDLVAGAAERRHLRRTFARFVGAPILDDVIAATGADQRLPPREVEATVLFADLRGFSRFAEDRPAPVVIGVLDRYLAEMSDAVLERGGTVVSYMGDGIMAVFGAPVEAPDHARRAVEAAQEMTGPALERFNAWLREGGVHDGFRMGVGLNTGPVMSGTIGSERRIEYAAVGDTTNVAARLEAMTKVVGHPVLVAEATYERLGGARAGLERVGELALAGRGTPCVAWATGGVL